MHFSATEATLLAYHEPNNPEAQHASGLINGFFGSEAQAGRIDGETGGS